MKKKKTLSILGATLLAMSLQASPVLAETGDVPSDSKTTAVTISNIDGAAEVKAYRVIKPVYNDEGFVEFVKATGVSIADIENPTAAEATTIAQALINGTVTADKVVSMTKGTDPATTYTASLPAGEYIVLVKNASNASYIYNPMIVSTYYTDANEADSLTAASDLNATTGTFGTNGYGKRVTIPLDKTILEADGNKGTDKNALSTQGSQADDLGIGDTGKFQITTKIPAYSDAYKAKGVKYTITDTQDAGFDAPTNIVVTVGTETITASEASSNTTFTQTIKDGNDFVLDFASAFVLAHAGQDVKVTYSAKLNSNAAQKLTANNDTVKLEFTNDAYDKSDIAYFEDDVQEYTFPVQVKKIEEINGTSTGDATENPLEGAEFTLTRTDGTGKTGTNEFVIETDEDGIAQFDRLDEGTYTLKETKAPEGYSINSDVFQITITPTYNATTGKLTSYAVEMINTSKDDAEVGSIVVDSADDDILAGNITDTKLQTLPATGGRGTMMVFVLAACMAGITGLIFAYGKKKEKELK